MTDTPRTRQQLREYLLERLSPDFEPRLDRFLDAMWPLYQGVVSQIELPDDDGDTGEASNDG